MTLTDLMTVWLSDSNSSALL